MTPDEMRAFIESECRRLGDLLPALREKIKAAEAECAATAGALQAFELLLRKMQPPAPPAGAASQP